MGTPRKHVQSAVKEDSLVRIVVPRKILRFGYPKSLQDYVVEIKSDPELWPKLESACYAATGRWKWGSQPLVTEQVEKAVRELAYVRGKNDGWGGSKRSMHFQECPELLGKQARVFSVKRKHEGTRCPGRNYEYESEPPTFDLDRAVRVLTLALYSDYNEFISPNNYSIEVVRVIHGHGGMTKIVWTDPEIT